MTLGLVIYMNNRRSLIRNYMCLGTHACAENVESYEQNLKRRVRYVYQVNIVHTFFFKLILNKFVPLFRVFILKITLFFILIP